MSTIGEFLQTGEMPNLPQIFSSHQNAVLLAIKSNDCQQIYPLAQKYLTTSNHRSIVMLNPPKDGTKLAVCKTVQNTYIRVDKSLSFDNVCVKSLVQVPYNVLAKTFNTTKPSFYKTSLQR